MATRRLGGIATSSSVPDNGGDHSGGGDSHGGVSDDVFSTYTYKGTATVTDIKNGINLAGKGGMVWLKSREGWKDHQLIRNDGGTLRSLSSNAESAENANPYLLAFNSDGFTLGNGSQANASGEDYASWTFRKAPKFFDVVTYTGDGTTGREIRHNLDCEVGTIFVKDLNNTSNWYVYHRGLTSANYGLQLNKTDAEVVFGSGYVTNTTFSFDHQNSSGYTYVAYLFAHDDSRYGSPDSIIKCGSYNANAVTVVELGFEPQWLLTKAKVSGNWYMYDTMRGWGPSGASSGNTLLADSANVEYVSGNEPKIRPTGFTSFNDGGKPYIYMAIRRPTNTGGT